MDTEGNLVDKSPPKKKRKTAVEPAIDLTQQDSSEPEDSTVSEDRSGMATPVPAKREARNGTAKTKKADHGKLWADKATDTSAKTGTSQTGKAKAAVEEPQLGVKIRRRQPTSLRHYADVGDAEPPTTAQGNGNVWRPTARLHVPTLRAIRIAPFEIFHPQQESRSSKSNNTHTNLLDP